MHTGYPYVILRTLLLFLEEFHRFENSPIKYQFLFAFRCRFKKGIEKSDAMRLIVLEHFGGFYLDLDMECRRPLSDYLRNHVNVSCIFDQERHLQSFLLFDHPFLAMNNVIISRPGHPFLKFLISKLPVHSNKGE